MPAPAQATAQPAYFKSTDGHFGNWGFSLRRPNLHLLPLLLAHSGSAPLLSSSYMHR